MMSGEENCEGVQKEFDGFTDSLRGKTSKHNSAENGPRFMII